MQLLQKVRICRVTFTTQIVFHITRGSLIMFVQGGSANLGYLYRCRVSAFLHVCQFEPRLFLKSHFKTFDQIEPAIFLLSKSQAQPPIKILYLFCNYTHSSSLKNPIPCQSFFNPPLWDPLHNIHQPNKDRIRLLSQLTWKEKNQTSVSSIHYLTFLKSVSLMCSNPQQ